MASFLTTDSFLLNIELLCFTRNQVQNKNEEKDAIKRLFYAVLRGIESDYNEIRSLQESVNNP